MLTLYIANKNYSSWSLRPWVLMRELGIPFGEQLRPFGRDGAGDFRSFSPSGKVPCLVDGDTVVWDSLAITEYLAERHAAVWPRDRKARAFARCAAAEMHSGFDALRGTCGMNVGLRVRLNGVSPALAADLARLDELWADGLARFDGPFVAGSAFTAADAFFAPVAFRIQTYSPPVAETSAAYAGRLLDLPSMRAWYEAALAEPWRDEPHDAEARAAGTVLQDLRRPPH
jgi:glutathione S-transferase